MVIATYLFIIIINLILAHEKKNSKSVMLISYIAIMLLMCGYRRPFYGDLDNYYYMYIGQQDLPIGMDFIFKIFSVRGIDFYTAHYILLGVFLFVSMYVIRKFCENWHYAIALFSGYYIIISADQIKNHTAFIFLCLAIMCLYKNQRVKATLFILFASLVHYSFVIYLLFVLISPKKSKQVIKICIAISLIYAVIATLRMDTVIVNNLIPAIISVFESKIETFAEMKVQHYFSTRTSWGFLLCVALQLINYVLLKYSRQLMIKRRVTNKIEFIDFVIRLNEIGFMAFPLFVYNMQWYRIIRELLLINYCVYGCTYYYLKKNTRSRLLYLCATLGSVYIWLIGDLCFKTTPELVIIPFFTNNIFL